MDVQIASVVFSGIAILISVFGTLRIARTSSMLQQWTYRQKVGEELSALSSLLVQCELLTQREQFRNEMVEREAKRLQLRSPGHSAIADALRAVAESRAAAVEAEIGYADIRETKVAMWNLSAPSADQLARAQQMKASIESLLFRLKDADAKNEQTYKKFMDSAALVP